MGDRWEPIGPILRLQVQRAALTDRGGYDLSHLIEVDALRLTRDGVFGRHEGEWVIDLHHRRHPDSRNRKGRNPLSIGLSGHYRRMAARYGSAQLGVGGENLVVQGGDLDLDDLAGGLQIRRSAGRPISLGDVRVCEPCVYFARHVSGEWATREELQSELDFLGYGTRGFLVALEDVDEPAEVSAGDELWRYASSSPAAKSSAEAWS